jgi:dTDP-4-amino-4,6-dideoxygalactose transaminase
MVTRKIKFLDLKKINSKFEDEFKIAFSSFLDKGWYILGENVSAFEKEFARFCKVKHAIGVNSGLDALVLPLMAYKEMGVLVDGDEILVPANTFIATVLAISQVGLKPVLVEPNLATMNIELDGIKKALTPKSKVIMPVHLYGRICPMQDICSFAKENNLIVLEDSAQAHGASISGKPSGGWGDVSGFSFYPGKNLGALGDGGAITTDNDELAQMVKMIRNYGTKIKYEHEVAGVNSRLDELQASFLRIKLRSYSDELFRRREIAHRYYSEIKNEKIVLLEHATPVEHAYHLFVVRVTNRSSFQKYLENSGIESLIHYPKLVYKQKPYLDIEFSHVSLEKSIDEIVSIPIGSHLDDTDIDYIVEVINKYNQ